MLRFTRPMYVFPAGVLVGLAMAVATVVLLAALLGATLNVPPGTRAGAIPPAAPITRSAPAVGAPVSGPGQDITPAHRFGITPEIPSGSQEVPLVGRRAF